MHTFHRTVYLGRCKFDKVAWLAAARNLGGFRCLSWGGLTAPLNAAVHLDERQAKACKNEVYPRVSVVLRGNEFWLIQTKNKASAKFHCTSCSFLS